MTEALHLFTWPDYLDPDVLARFTAETGTPVCEVNYSTDEECVRRILGGESLDVVIADDISATRLRRSGLLMPLDMDRLPAFRSVRNERLRRPPHDPETDGHKYTSVLFFGTEGFAVRLDRVERVHSSWEMLFDPSFAGEIAMLDSAREVLSVALYRLGVGPNTIDEQLLDEATRMMVEQRRLVCAYDSDYPSHHIIAGVKLVHCWDGDAIRAINAGTTQLRYVLPQEGFTVWADAPCILAAARDADAAYRFIDFLLKPEVAAACADFSGYHPVVEAADPLIGSLVQRSLRPTEFHIETGTFYDDLSESEDVFEAAYAKVRGT